MEYNYFVYSKPECGVKINKMPKWFQELEYKGDENHGVINLHSQNEYDEIWGSEAKMEINWEKKDRLNLFYYKEVQNSIDVYNAVGFVVTEKNRNWLLSHEITFWYGQRTKMIRKRFYQEKGMHCVFYCDISERLFNIHTSMIGEQFENYKPYILNSYNSVVCHGD
ncbi:MAG: hypothetical protein ACFFDF_14335 [Candidatus Odinarchaeota archaeon]